jgi:hypothetical protein
MKRKTTFIRIALAAGLVGLAACGGSDSSTNRNRNAAIATNVSHIEGQLLVTNPAAEELLTTQNEFKIAMDVDYQVKGSGDNTNYDLRKAFSNFQVSTIKVVPETSNLAETIWSTCPVIARLEMSPKKVDPTAVHALRLQFRETTAAVPCNSTPSDKKATFNIYVTSFEDALANVEDDAVVSLEDLKLVNVFTDSTKYSVLSEVKYPNLAGEPWVNPITFSSTKINDYQPSALSATSEAAGLKVSWARSADLTAEDLVGYNIEWSTVEDFATVAGNLAIAENIETAVIESCSVTRSIPLQKNQDLFVRLTPRIADNDKADPISVKITRTPEDFLCPKDKPEAPTNVGAKITEDGLSVEVSWDAVTPTDSTINYCVSQEDTSGKDGPQFENVGCSPTSPLILDHGVNMQFGSGKATYVVTTVDLTLHSMSDFSTPITVDVPVMASITDISSSLTDDGSVLFRWKPLSSDYSKKYSMFQLFETIMFFDVNREIPCRADMTPSQFLSETMKFLLTNGLDQNWLISHIRIIRSVDGGQILSPESLGPEFKPGATVSTCILRLGPWGLSKLAAGSYKFPAETAVETSTTLAPVVEDTAKTAIVTEAATEVQLPAAAVEVAVNVEDVYTGFGVTASDVKSIEYQIDAGSWTAVTPGAALKIPNAASKMAVRVTKTNGETVVSEKVIVRTEETTETTVGASDSTMAPADTTAPVTTEAPGLSELSESSSSNNILLYILGFVILAAIAGFLFKKKSASTK